MSKVYSETCTMNNIVYDMPRKSVCNVCSSEYLPEMGMAELFE